MTQATGVWGGEGAGREEEVTATRSTVRLSDALGRATASFFSPTAAPWSLVVVQRSVPEGTDLLSGPVVRRPGACLHHAPASSPHSPTAPQLWTAAVAALATALGISVMVVWSTREVKGELQLKQELEERTDEVLRARDEAQAANKAKSLFLANMRWVAAPARTSAYKRPQLRVWRGGDASIDVLALAQWGASCRRSHEIRTPMTGILGLVDLMLDAADLSDEHRDNLRSVRHCGKTLLQLLNDILDLVSPPTPAHRTADRPHRTAHTLCPRSRRPRSRPAAWCWKP